MARARKNKKRSIFQAIFVPLICLMIAQSVIFYGAAVYGGVKDTLNQNAADIVRERLTNRKNELETEFNNNWTDMNYYEQNIGKLYNDYEHLYGKQPFIDQKDTQIRFLGEASKLLVDMIRSNQVNGVFLILNDKPNKVSFPQSESVDVKYGVNIRDMDATSAYTGTDDLLIERSPSSLVETIGCSLDSWWDASYQFSSKEDGLFYYQPLQAAYNNPEADGEDIAYLCGAHHISSSDPQVVSYSIPLMDEDGYPYGVLGVELTVQYLASLMPNQEINNSNDSCYVLGIRPKDGTECSPIATSGTIYSRCFSSDATIDCSATDKMGGFIVTGHDDVTMYGDMAKLNIYNNNNPFEDDELVLIAMTQRDSLFYYSNQIKRMLFLVSMITLTLGVIGIFCVSRRFAAPITSLARKARTMDSHSRYHLEHLGIQEIDLLVDSIEELNANVSKEIARTEFFSRMSHDMRTPMNAIISFSSAEMLEGADEAQRDEYLGKIHSSGEYLLGLINEVLDMTKIESNKVDLHYETIKADTICETVIPMVEKLAMKNHVTFIHKLELPDDLYLKVDTQHLNQIMINLLSNAVKFTPEGGTVKLEICRYEKVEISNKVYCTIIVEDTGIGMSDKFMEKLYTPFEQEHEGEGGTGLGLSITKKLVELMGGTIQCNSELGTGTKFMLTIAFDKMEKKEQQVIPKSIEPESQPEEKEHLDGKHILLCEDHPLNTQIAIRLLERKGMIVDTASNGRIGVDKFAQSKLYEYDAVLMDIRMPEMTGLEAADAIRHLDREDAKVIPIIAMTANAFEEDIRKSRAAGMNEHLSKPIEPEKLYHALNELIVETKG